MIVLCDMDGVLVDIMSSWLQMYNRDYDDSLKVNAITTRNIENYVKPDCGKDIYKYIVMKGFFRQAQPYADAKAGIARLLNADNDVWFITAPAINGSKRTR